MHKVGEKLNFTFDTRAFEIIEIIDKPNISMWRILKSDVCPHCKKEIDRRYLYTFDYVIVLIPENIDSKTATFSDTIMIGVSKDTTLLLTEDKMKEVLKNTTTLQHLEVI